MNFDLDVKENFILRSDFVIFWVVARYEEFRFFPNRTNLLYWLLLKMKTFAGSFFKLKIEGIISEVVKVIQVENKYVWQPFH